MPYLPQFPLKLVAFPQEQINLHIFELRYKQLIRDCLTNNLTFGIPPHKKQRVMELGTEIELLEIVKEYPGGEMDIKTRGIGIYKLLDFDSKIDKKLYPGGEIERIEIDYETDFEMTNEILEKTAELFKILKIKKEVPFNTPQFTTYHLAHHVGFNFDQEFEFLRIPVEQNRQKYMLAHLKKLIPVVREMEALRKRVQMNGHFKNIEPPKF